MMRDLNFYAWLKEDMEARHDAGDVRAAQWLEAFAECERLWPADRGACLERLDALTPDDAAARVQAHFTGDDGHE